MWSGERLTRIQATTRPDYSWPEIWCDMSKVAQKKEKQVWATEKAKLDKARKQRQLFHRSGRWRVLGKSSENARRKLEVPMGATMLCKLRTKKRLKLREIA